MENLAYFIVLLNSFILPTQFSTTELSEALTASTVVEAYAHSNPVDFLSSTFAFEDSVQHLYSSIDLQKYNLPYAVFKYGMIGYYSLKQSGKLGDKNLLSIIDFTKPSTEKRFYTIDLDHLKVLYHSYVSHGKNTGENIAKAFSNIAQSNQSSIGFYTTAETYIGSKGYSLKLDGMEKGYNDKIRERAVVMHEAEYVSEHWIKQNGRLGRSQGCPALPKAIAHEVIDVIKGGTAIFAYFNDESYLSQSAYLDLNKVLSTVTARLNP